MKRAICLLSGGIDSATTAALAKSEGFEILGLTVDYGQRHLRELECARKQSRALALAEHVILKVDLSAWGGSALTSKAINVPPGKETGEDEIPVTYVPARNLVFLSLAVSFAEAREAEKVYFGANSRDYSGYPDCRPEFVEAFDRAAELGTRIGIEGRPIEVRAPLQDMTKAEILKKGLDLGVDFSATWSCYRGEKEACGECDSCRIRLAAFEEIGVKDPIQYRARRRPAR